MNEGVVILVAEDDEGHFSLISRNLHRAGLSNEVIWFADGQEVLDFLFMKGRGPKRQHKKEYLLLLDIRLPKINGVKVLEKIKRDKELKKIPVIMLTVIDEPGKIELCHSLGCSIYIVKPVEYDGFVKAIRKVGLFLSVVKVPQINETQ